MKNEEKINSGEIAVKGGFLGWLDNYWYHYKWPTIGGLFLIVVLVVGLTQCISKEDEDLVVLYAGRTQFSVGEANAICEVLEAISPAKGENSKNNVGITYFQVMSEDQIKQAEAETDSDGKKKYTVDRNYLSDQYDSYYSQLLTGDHSVVFVEPWLYEKLVRDSRLVSLKDVLGYVPEGAVGEHGVRLGSLDIYENYGAIKNVMDEDTVVCILHPNAKITFSKNSNEKYYENEKSLFRAIIEYKSEKSEG